MRRGLEIALNRARRLGRSTKGVLGVDYGFVYKDSVRLRDLGIRFHVAEKLPLSQIPPELLLPEDMAAYQCDVLEARYSLHASPREEVEPLQPGISIGNILRQKTGTLGPLVFDRLRGAPGLLSNWHVLCGSPLAAPLEPIVQPGPHHLGTGASRTVALLERWAGLDTGCDAALALLDGSAGVNLVFGEGMPVRGVEEPRIGMKVVKYGAISGFTHGMVDGIAGSYELDYSSYGDEKRWIDGIRIVSDPARPEAEISLAGDSGSVWVNVANQNAVALHFAGEDGLGPTAEYALALSLPRVMSLLDVELLTDPL